MRFNFVRCILLVGVLCFGSLAWANNWPVPPKNIQHPGNGNYEFSVQVDKLTINKRLVEVYRPKGPGPYPVIVFGHGQAMESDSYVETFRHLAGKGIAVVFPFYDKGFLDQEWKRMAKDFVELFETVVSQNPNLFLTSHIVYAGHSKGGYVGLMALGQSKKYIPKAGVFFAPAGYDSNDLRNIEKSIAVSLIWGEKDNVVKQSLGDEIYSQLTTDRRQIITVHSYVGADPALPADHFVISNKKSFFGGRDGVTPFHYYGCWGWLIGAIQDNEYLYGTEALSSGWEDLIHSVKRNWGE